MEKDFNLIFPKMETSSESKCKDCVRLNQIKALSKELLKRYEELLAKSRENEQQYNVVVDRLQEREGMLEDMKKLIEPALAEHERLMFKYDIELECRSEAENIARRMTVQNQVLKRQSQALLDHLGKLDVTTLPPEILEEDSAGDGETESYKNYTDTLHDKIRELEEKVSSYVAALGDSREKAAEATEENIRLKQRNEYLKQSLNQTENTLTQYKKALLELSTMSESAYEEYEHLKSKYEIELRRRSDTEKGFKKMEAQNMAMKKQSAILLSNVASNQQLTQAMFKIDELEEENSGLNQKVSHLEQQIEQSSSQKTMEELEIEKSNLSSEVDELTMKVSRYEKMYADLELKYKELEKKLEDALRPPPPPPPPLPPPVTQSKGFLSRIGNKKSKKVLPKQVGTDFNQESYGKALDEMMKRINSGKALSKTLRPTLQRTTGSQSEPSGAMKELHNVLNRYKKTHSESDALSTKDPVNQMDPESEFAKMFRKVKKSIREDSNDVFE